MLNLAMETDLPQGTTSSPEQFRPVLVVAAEADAGVATEHVAVVARTVPPHLVRHGPVERAHGDVLARSRRAKFLGPVPGRLLAGAGRFVGEESSPLHVAGVVAGGSRKLCVDR